MISSSSFISPKPVIKYFKGWNSDISSIRNYEDLPLEAKEYIEFIEKEVNCKITYISVGPERESIIIRNKKEKSNYE